MPEVLFVCVHNAGRSHMAAALLDHHARGKVQVGDDLDLRVQALLAELAPPAPDAIAPWTRRTQGGQPTQAAGSGLDFGTQVQG